MVRGLLAAIIICAPASALGAAAVINSNGGTNTSNGVKITVGGSGQIQVSKYEPSALAVRDQFYTGGGLPGDTTNDQIDNGIYLGLGVLDQGLSASGTLIGPTHVNFDGSTGTERPAGMTYVDWTGSASGGSTGSGSATFNGSYNDGGRVFTIAVVYSYVVPNDFVTVQWTLVVPAGNTKPVTIYHAFDSLLAGMDNGPSFHSNAFGETVGVYDNTTMEAMRYVSGLAWTNFYAGLNNCMFAQWNGLFGIDCTPGGFDNNAMGRLATFKNLPAAPTGAVTDNGFGVQWVLPTTPGSYSATTELLFRAQKPTLTKAFAPSSVASDGVSTLIFTLENEPALLGHGSLQFTDVFPSPLRIASPPNVVLTGCSGTAQDSGGASLAANDVGFRLTGAAIATGVTSCTVSVDVVATNVSGAPTGLVNATNPNVSVNSNLFNGVSAQTLTVATRPPPTITSVTSTTASGLYGIGDTVAIDVNVSAPVPNGQSLQLTLSSGAIVNAACSPGPCSALHADYVVASGDSTPTLNVSSVSGSLTDTVGATNPSPSVPGGQNLSATKTITVDGIAPGAPAITGPVDASTLTNATITVSGSKPANTSLVVYEGAAVRCSIALGAATTFSCAAFAYAQGAHTIFAVASDAAGNPSANSPNIGFTVNAPVAISSVTSTTASGLYGIGATIGLDVNLTQTVNAGQSVMLTLSSGAMVNASCGAPGPCSALHADYVVASGHNTAMLTVTAVTGTLTDTGGGMNGSLSVPGGQNLDATKSIGVDGTPPAQPAITAPPNGSPISNATIVVSGNAPAGTTVSVLEGATLRCTVAANGSSQFLCPGVVYAQGAHTLHAIATDAAGNPSIASADYTFTVDAPVALMDVTSTTASGTYGIGDTIALDVGLTRAVAAGQQLTLALSSGAMVVATCAPPGPCTALHADYVVANGEQTTTLTITGTSGTLTDMGGGSATNPSVPGGANLDATRAIAIDGVPPAAPVIDVPPTTVMSTEVAITGTAPSGTTIIVYEGALEVCTANAVGIQFNCPGTLGQGEHDLFAVARDAAGNESPPSATMHFVVDVPNPAAPILVEPADGAKITTAGAVTIAGFAQPFAIVIVRVDGAEVCSPVADGDGAFGCEATLSDGAHAIDAYAKDGLGQESAASSTVHVTVGSASDGAGDGNGSGTNAGADANAGGDLDVSSRKQGCACGATSGADSLWWAVLVFALSRRRSRRS